MSGAPGAVVGALGAPRPLAPRILARLAGDVSPSSGAAPERGSAPVRSPADHRPSGPPAEPSGSWLTRLTRPSRALPVVVAALALVVTGLVVSGRGASGPAPGEAVVTVDGLATVRRTDGGSEQVTGRTRLGPGDRLQMQRGTAQMELNDDVAYRAVGPDGDDPGTDLQMGRTPSLRAGTLLVTAPRDTTLTAGAGDVQVVGGSAVRVTRSLATHVGVYRGVARLDSSGATRAVRGLRSTEAVAAGEVTAVRPVDYAAQDVWDRQYLGPALALDRQLVALEAGLEASSADADVLAQRLRRRSEVPISEAELTAWMSERGRALDAVVGLAVVGSSDADGFAERWKAAFAFHDAGADWGLVAMDQGADPDDVIDALSEAIDEAPLGRVPTIAPTPSTAAASDPGVDPAGPAPGTPSSTTSDRSGDPVEAAAPPNGGSQPGNDAAPGASPIPGGVGVTVPPAPPTVTPTVPIVGPVLNGVGSGLTSALGPITGPLVGPGGPLNPLVDPLLGQGGLLGPQGPLGPITGPLTGPTGPLAPITGPLTGSNGLLTGSGGLLPLHP